MTISRNAWTVASRVVYPVRDQDATLPLYAAQWTRPKLSETAIDPRLKMQRLDFTNMGQDDFSRLVAQGVTGSAAETGQRPVDEQVTINSRTSLTLAPGAHISLCTYFNAFPASYWKHWTQVTSVRFSARVKGNGEITLFKSTGRGLFSPVEKLVCGSGLEGGAVGRHASGAARREERVDTEAAAVAAANSAARSSQGSPSATDRSKAHDLDGEYRDIEVILPMTNLIDGGYFWFDAKAGRGSVLTVADAAWSVPEAERTAPKPSTLSIAITTFNRPTYCMNQLEAMRSEPELLQRLDTIYCVDQGTDLVEAQPGFEPLAGELGNKLTYIRQSNMGGSAGFSRGMFETLKAGSSAYTLLLDDDAISEPESILRALQFADYTRKPTIVGGGMFHLDNRTVLYTQGERLDPSRYWMKPSRGRSYNHDFAAFPLRDTPSLHARAGADFNGWWMCLIPVQVMREIGLSLPVFIKFDDMEYALRAREHGFPTVSLPGVAVWHQAWHDKDPGRTWEEYFTQRNRWICALLHSPKPNPRFAYDMVYGDAELGLKFIYSGVKLRHMALQDVLRGPQYVVSSMPGKLDEVRQARQGFADTDLHADAADFPEPARELGDGVQVAGHAAAGLSRVAALGEALASKRSGVRAVRPDVAIPAERTVWQSYTGVDSAVVTSPDGNSVAWVKRDSDLFRRQMKDGVRLAKALMERWETLSAQYRAADMAGVQVWERIFDAQEPKESQEPQDLQEAPAR